MATVYILLLYTVIHQASASLLNVAQGKTASASSLLPGFDARTAVDGNTAANYGGSRVIDTGEGNPFAWWKVDLKREVQDATVRIYFRTDFKGRRNGIKLYTSASPFSSYPGGQLCDTVTGDPSGSDIPDVYSVTCPGRWRYLLLFTDTDNKYNGVSTGPSLDFGEVEVFGCSDRTYGEDCTETCSSRNCVTMTTTCDRDGRCPDGCQPGWRGVDCTQILPPCPDNNYGLNCDKLCSDRKCKAPSTSSCDRLTGRCPDGCEAGWRQTDCTQACDPGSYGASCASTCSTRRCLSASSSCDHVTGQCDGGCQPGYKEPDCVYDCDSGSYGHDCSSPCSDRKCRDSSSECNHVTGQCRETSGQYRCTAGYKGLDCITECGPGNYGSGCNLSCADRYCSDSPSECDHVTGQCVDGCEAGYNGIDCSEECGQGNYGVNCALACAYRHCKQSSSECDTETGQCIGECQDGWTGMDCTSLCEEGTYGPDCTEKCGKCDGVCDRVDGRCPAGCLEGYNGTRCDVVLPEDINRREPDCYSAASLVGAVVGTFLVLVLVNVGTIICLIRQGRLQWMKSPENNKPVQESRDFTQLNSMTPQPSEVSEHAQSSNHVYNNDYAVLDSGTKTDNKDYDTIQAKHYQNL